MAEGREERRKVSKDGRTKGRREGGKESKDGRKDGNEGIEGREN